jgi:Na+-translocating ferredoxin:NAD+ oxidoreductase RNF subunit RnfB
MIAINDIMLAALALGGLGIAFAIILIVSNRYLAVKADPKVEMLMGALPGANCGACGFPGCQGFADALVETKAEPAGCIAGGAAVANKIALILGISVDVKAAKVAFVACRAGRKVSKAKYVYDGVQNCQAANLLFGGDKYCDFGCLGLGSCKLVCPFDAITITEEHLAVVDAKKCRSCEKCVKACPRKLIAMVPKDQSVLVACRNLDRGKRAKEVCSIACIACKICEKNCPTQAIKIENNLAVIDYEKCNQCNTCIEKCPQKSILTV